MRSFNFLTKIYHINEKLIAKLEDKIKRVKNANIDYSNVQYIETDFTLDNWQNSLINSDINWNKKVFCSLLGISYYLTKKQFYNMISKISKLICKGSTIVFDYPIIEDSKKEEITRKLAKGANEENQRMEFQYDFGDNWRFNIVLEKIFEDENISGKDLPRVIEGEEFGIIEDCGGTWGLEEVKKAFKTKKGEKYETYSNWLGKEELDLEKCDLDDLNFRLKNYLEFLEMSTNIV